MENLPFSEYLGVTRVIEIGDTEYADKLLSFGWKLLFVGSRYFQGDTVPRFILGWAEKTDPQY